MKKEVGRILVMTCRISLLFFLSTVIACKKERVDNESFDGLSGKWKLLKIEVYSGSLQELNIESYENNQVTYLFMKGGTLEINSDLANHSGYEAGRYTYSINEKFSIDDENESYTIKIGQNSHHIQVNQDSMTINLNPVDPLAIYESSRNAFLIKIDAN